MAKAPKKKLVHRRRRQSSEGGGFFTLLLIGLAAIAIFKFQAAIMVAAGLLPTIVLSITGKGDNKSEKLQCVAFANMAGIFTILPKVWDGSISVSKVFGEPINLLIIMGGAVFGYALIYIGPHIAAIVLQGFAQDKLKNIAAQRQNLIETWGHEVLGDKEEAKVVQTPRVIR